MLLHRSLAEALGAFTLTLVVALSLTVPHSIITPILAALTLGTFVYTIGNLSGAHLNPAVTIGLCSVRKISTMDALAYVIAQIAGAAIAMLVAKTMLNGIPQVTAANTLSIGVAEALGTFFLAFGVASVASGKVHSAASGLTVGLSLLLGIVIAGYISNGVLNPAVAIGIGSFSPMYILGPIVGGILGAWAQHLLAQEKFKR